jgi:RNA polymerase sporulation-specific sigma factor
MHQNTDTKNVKTSEKLCRFTQWLVNTRLNNSTSLCINGNCAGEKCSNYKQYRKSIKSTIRKAQAGDTEAVEKLIQNFKNFVYQMEKRYFIPGGEKEDLIQEGFIGLYQAIRTYKPGNGMSFEDYASLCIRNSVIRAIRSATQKKQMVLTQAKSIFDKNILSIKSQQFEPEFATINNIEIENVREIIQSKLTSSESEMISMKANGFSTKEIALNCNTEKKTVDNALYRARLKIRQHLEPKDILASTVNLRSLEKSAKLVCRKKI